MEGLSVRAFIHIKDVVRATLKLALEGEPGTTWHLSTNESVSIYKLVKQIFELCDADFENLVLCTEERLGKDQNYLLDSTAMRQKYGWYDEVSLKEGLQETLDWVDENLPLLKNYPGTISTSPETARNRWMRLQGISADPVAVRSGT